MTTATKPAQAYISLLKTYWHLSGLVFVLLLTSIAYYPGLSGPFTFDDMSNILLKKDLFINEFSVSKILVALSTDQSGPLGRPVSILSFIINYYFSGLNPYYFKLTNLVIHLLNGISLFILTRLLLQKFSTLRHENYFTENKINTISLIVASIWLLHPLNLTSVLYIVQRMTSLSALFTTLALVCYIFGRNELDKGSRKGFLYILLGTTGFGLLALFSKENGINLILYILLIEFFFYGFTTHDNTKKLFKSLWLGAGFIFLLAVLVLFLKDIDLFRLNSYQYRNFNLEERLLTEARVVLFYIRLILLPSIREMGIYHDDIVLSTGLMSPASTLISIIAITTILIFALFIRKKEPVLAFGILWFFASHLLESTIIPLELVHEHRNYLAQYGLILGIFFVPFSNTYSLPKIARLKYPVIITIITLLFFGTFFRADIWSSEWKLLNAGVKYHPASPRAQTALAILYADNGMYAKAMPHFQTAADLNKCSIDSMVRVVQFEYIRNKIITEKTFNKLQKRAVNCPYTYVSIWVFEGLLDEVSSNKKYRTRLLGIYDMMITRQNIKLQPQWAIAAYTKAGGIYYELGNYQKTIDFYEKIFPLGPKAFHFVHTAILYVELGNVKRAYEVIQELEKRRLVLTPQDEENLTGLRSIFEQELSGNSSPKL